MSELKGMRLQLSMDGFGSDEAQGYHFFKPLPHTDLIAILGSNAASFVAGH